MLVMIITTPGIKDQVAVDGEGVPTNAPVTLRGASPSKNHRAPQSPSGDLSQKTHTLWAYISGRSPAAFITSSRCHHYGLVPRPRLTPNGVRMHEPAPIKPRGNEIRSPSMLPSHSDATPCFPCQLQVFYS